MNRLDTFPDNDLVKYYRNTFASVEGQTVLAHIMYELGLFQEISLSPEDMALKNYASRLLNILGGGEVAINSIKSFIGQIGLQQLKEKKTSK
jgi:hypothetical protein